MVFIKPTLVSRRFFTGDVANTMTTYDIHHAISALPVAHPA
jgi:hypothetical protein